MSTPVDPALDLDIATAVHAVFDAMDVSLTSDDLSTFTRWLAARELAAWQRGCAFARQRRCPLHGPIPGMRYCPECASDGKPWTEQLADDADEAS